MEHLLIENIVGELGFDLPDAALGEIGLTWFCRPCYHVDMGVRTLVVEGGVPAELTGRNVHGLRDLVAVSTEEVSPLGGVVVAQPLGILPLEGDDVRPNISRVLVELLHGGV